MLVLQGHKHGTGNFVYLIKEINDECNVEVSQWLKRRNHFSSDTIQNEILWAYAHNVLNEIKKSVEDSMYIVIICDSIIVYYGIEPESITLCYISEDLNAHKDFLSF